MRNKSSEPKEEGHLMTGINGAGVSNIIFDIGVGGLYEYDHGIADCLSEATAVISL